MSESKDGLDGISEYFCSRGDYLLLIRIHFRYIEGISLSNQILQLSLRYRGIKSN